MIYLISSHTLLSENFPSNMGSRLIFSEYWNIRSATHGIPRIHSLGVPGLGIRTRFTGRGRYLHSRSDSDRSRRFVSRVLPYSSMLIPSIPGTPLFLLTALYAALSCRTLVTSSNIFLSFRFRLSCFISLFFGCPFVLSPWCCKTGYDRSSATSGCLCFLTIRVITNLITSSLTCSVLRLQSSPVMITCYLFYPLIRSPESSPAGCFTTTMTSSDSRTADNTASPQRLV